MIRQINILTPGVTSVDNVTLWKNSSVFFCYISINMKSLGLKTEERIDLGLVSFDTLSLLPVW